MKCPDCGLPAFCKETRTRIAYMYRRYECEEGHKFSTQEVLIETKLMLFNKMLLLDQLIDEIHARAEMLEKQVMQ